MKPDAKYIKLVETAKLIKNSEDKPYSYIGNLMEPDIKILAEVFKEINPELHQKVEKMLQVPLRGKELAVDGPGLAQILGITNKKDFPMIGVAQKKVLAALWDGQIQNNPKEINDFLQNSVIKEEFFKPNLIPKGELSYTSEMEMDDELSNTIEAFINHALTFLRLQDKPTITFVVTRRHGMTHGCFSPDSEEILVYVTKRALADFLRTLAHELVHLHQRKIGKIELDKTYQAIGGELEDEANAIGGQIIKSFGKNNPHIYDM
jgi:hypothetical protein